MCPASTLAQPLRSVVAACLVCMGSTATFAADPSPSPNLTPEDVIQLQIQALSGKGPQQSRIAKCYQFASPANRRNTGPVDRFRRMVNGPSYAVLLNAKHFLVGRATIKGSQAHLLLTVIDANGRLSLFRCLLSKQSAAPYVDCWMTDAVVRIGEVGPAKVPQDSPVQPTPTI